MLHPRLYPLSHLSVFKTFDVQARRVHGTKRASHAPSSGRFIDSNGGCYGGDVAPFPAPRRRVNDVTARCPLTKATRQRPASDTISAAKVL